MEAQSDPSAIGDRISTLFAASPIETPDIATAPITSDTGQTTTQSRGYGVVQELLLSKTANAFDEFDSILDGTPYTISLTPYMLNTLSSLPADFNEQQAKERIELIHKAGKVASITLSVGFVSWKIAAQKTDCCAVCLCNF